MYIVHRQHSTHLIDHRPGHLIVAAQERRHATHYQIDQIAFLFVNRKTVSINELPFDECFQSGRESRRIRLIVQHKLILEHASNSIGFRFKSN